jgi:selenocysteine-specific elongation factor
LEARCELTKNEFKISLEKLLHTGKIINLSGKDSEREENTFLVSHNWLTSIFEKVESIFEAYYRKNPFRLGMKREELRTRLHLELRIFEAMLAYWLNHQVLEQSGELVFPAGHSIQFAEEQKRLIGELMKHFSTEPYSPPTVDECKQSLGNEAFQALLDLGELIQISKDVVFRPQEYRQLINTIEQILTEKGAVSLAEVRDHFHTSRRYALAILEHMDEKGMTIREGDVRRLKKRN